MREMKKNFFKTLRSFGVILLTATLFVQYPLILSGKAHGEETKPPISLRGADMGAVSRLVIDGIPENGYILKPAHNRLDIQFNGFEWSFLRDDLLKGGLLQNVAKIETTETDQATMLSIVYSCNCQGDFYKWKDKKLVLDIFSLEAAGNPLKMKKSVFDKAEMKKKPDDKAKMKKSAEMKKQADKMTEAEKPAPVPDIKPQEKAESGGNDLQAKLRALFQGAEAEGVVSFKGATSGETKADTAAPSKKPTETAQTDTPGAERTASNGDRGENFVARIIGAEGDRPVAVNKRNMLTDNVSVGEGGGITPIEESLLPGDQVLDLNMPCLPGSAFALPANAPRRESFYGKISEYRGKLVDEFDKPNIEIALKLAQFYISYGMGDEALQVLNIFNTNDRRATIYRSMAVLLAQRSMKGKSVFADTSKDCKSAHALWKAYYAYRAGKGAYAARLTGKENVMKAVEMLPVTLQSHIGSALALNLVREGKSAEAEMLIDAVANNIGQFDTAVLLVRGLIDAKEGAAYRAVEALESVMENAVGPDAQMAGLAVSELKLATDEPLREEELSALEEVAFLKSREIDGARALALIAEYHARKDDFATAFKRLSQTSYFEEGVKDPVAVKTERLFRRMAVNGEGTKRPDNLVVFWKYNDMLPENPALYYNFAERLYELGHDAATVEITQYIQKHFETYADTHDVTFLQAKAYIRLGAYEDAENALSDKYPNDPEYALLKAKVLGLNNKHEAAYAALAAISDLNTEKEKGYQAMMAKDWAKAQTAYEAAYTYKNEAYTDKASRMTGYMAGKRYPGKALEYNTPLKIVYQSAEGQEFGPEEAMKESKYVTELIKDESEKLLKFIHDNGLTPDSLTKGDVPKNSVVAVPTPEERNG